MTVDELERIARYRPRAEVSDSVTVIDRIIGSAPKAQTRAHGRPAAMIGIAAAIAAGAVVLPALMPTGSPAGPTAAAAAELDRLASRAAASIDTPLKAGQYRHAVITEHQASPEVSTKMESWIGSDGRVWRRDVTTHADGTAGRTDTFLFTTPEPVAMGLPTDPEALRRYLIAHASGSTSTDEAVFQRLAELLRGPVVPAPLRAAATQVLAHTGHVSLGPRTTDNFGRTVQEINFVEEVGRPNEVQTIVFDTTDGRVTAERITVADASLGGPLFQASVTPLEITDTIPADVVRDAVEYGANADTDPRHGG